MSIVFICTQTDDHTYRYDDVKHVQIVRLGETWMLMLIRNFDPPGWIGPLSLIKQFSINGVEVPVTQNDRPVNAEGA